MSIIAQSSFKKKDGEEKIGQCTHAGHSITDKVVIKAVCFILYR